MRLEVVGPVAEFGGAGLEDRPSAPIRRARVALKVEDRMAGRLTVTATA